MAGGQNTGALEALREELSLIPGISVKAASGDIGDEGFVAALFEGLKELDILINCAGCACYRLLHEMSAAEWDLVFRTNLRGAFLTCRAAIPLMLKKHSGRIINISSIQGRTGASMEAAYSASKAGLDGLTRALAKELAPSGIAVNTLSPGMVDTKMNARFSAEEKNVLLDEIPMGRFTDPSETAAAVRKLARMPSYVTGQILEMSGGWG